MKEIVPNNMNLKEWEYNDKENGCMNMKIPKPIIDDAIFSSEFLPSKLNLRLFFVFTVSLLQMLCLVTNASSI